MHTQTIIQSNKEQTQIEPGTRKKKMLAQIKQGTRKSKEKKKKLVRRPAKSMPLWSAEILPLLHQITKIDSSICFGFCVWFCSWVFGAGSGREWRLIHSPFSLLITTDCFESDCLREYESVGLGLGLGFGSCFVVVFWVCCWEEIRVGWVCFLGYR